jgi:hypothetical protein
MPIPTTRSVSPTIRTDATIARAAYCLARTGGRELVVLGANGCPVGRISSNDVLEGVALGMDLRMVEVVDMMRPLPQHVRATRSVPRERAVA